MHAHLPELPKYDFQALEEASSLMYRLADEHRRIHQLALANPEMVRYEVMKTSREKPQVPTEYKIRYFLNSYVGLSGEGHPISETEHELSIQLSMQYPAQPAQLKMLTPTWHPNIKSAGPFRGTICTNHQGFGSLFYLDELIIRIGRMLQYQKYWVTMAPPYPEDMKVAQWVVDVAEPQRLVDKSQGKALDNREWKEYVEIEMTEVDFSEEEADSGSEVSGDDPGEINIFE